MSNRDPITYDILAEGTGAANSAEFKVGVGEKVVVYIYPAANLAAETGALKYKDPNGTFIVVGDSGGAIALSATRNVLTLEAPGTYRVDAAARTAAWGIAVTR